MHRPATTPSSASRQPGDLTTSGYPFIVKRVVRGEPLSAAKEIFRGTAKDGGYGVSIASFHDGDGHKLVVINRPLSTFESENYLVTKTGVEQLGLHMTDEQVKLLYVLLFLSSTILPKSISLKFIIFLGHNTNEP